MSIQVNHITKQYGEQIAVNDVSFTIPNGETCGFLGPNGAGKSTTLKLITGVLQPTTGTIQVNGIDVSQQPIVAKRNIGYLAEHNPLYKDMYVREFLQFIASTYQLENKRSAVADAIEITGLGKEAHKLIGELSKGYQQRVGLAQALIHNPNVLILDEPLSGLDPNQLEELRKLIRELGKEKTVLFSSHILQEVEQVCNRVLVINDGLLVADEYYDDRASDSITIVEFEELLTEQQLAELNKIAKVSHINRKYLIKASGKAIRKAIFEFAIQHQFTILELKEERETLTNLFQTKTKQK